MSPATITPLGVAARTSSLLVRPAEMVTVADVRFALSMSVTVSAGASAVAGLPSVNTSAVPGTPPRTGGFVAGLSPKIRTLSMQMYSLVALLCITTRTCTEFPVGKGRSNS